MLKSIFDKIEQSYLIRQLPQATVFLNKRLQIIHASNSWAKEFGLDKTEIPGKSLPSLFEEVADDVKELVKDCLSGKKSITTIKRHIDSHENERWYQWQCKPWYDENENIIGTILQHDNITNRIKNELVLEKQKSLLEESSEMHQMGYWEYNALSSAMQWTSITLKIHEVGNGFKPTLDNFTDFYAEGHSKNTISMALYEAIEKFRPWNERLELITAKGRKRWVQSIGRPIVRNNEFIGLVGTIKDVTQEVENEKRSRQNEQLLKTMIDHLPINVYIKDKESRKILVNKAECDFLGVKDPEELLGKNDFDLYDTEAARADREEDLYVMKNLRPILLQESVAVHKNGTKTALLTSKIPLIDEQGEAYGLVGISLDISDLKRKEEELKNLINVTSQQNKKLINFAHIVSHNLRSHTANLSMLLDFLIQEKDEKERKRIIKMLTEASDNLLETLENLNEVVAINTNVNQEKRWVELTERINYTVKNLEPFIRNHNAKVINYVPNTALVKVVPAYLDSILMNFITNAIKFRAPERSPVVSLSTKKEGEYTVLSIEDNGLGIDLEKYGDKLFGMYKTFHEHIDSRGIGLYIAKNQIEAMNGKVKVHSKVGLGTIFKIYFNEAH